MTLEVYRLNREISKLGYAKTFRKPQLQSCDRGIFDWIVFGVPIFAVAGGVIGIIAGLIAGETLFLKLMGIIGGIIYFGIGGAVVGLVASIVFGVYYKNKEENRLLTEYQNQQRYYDKQTVADKRRVQTELRQKNCLIKQRDKLLSHLYDAESLLSNFYDTIGIVAEYRNLIPIGYMNMYINMGIANKLEGVDGLNYLIRQELRQDQMQHTLDEISQKLDMILDRQDNIYRELVEIRKNSDIIVQKTMEQVKMAVNNKQLMENIEENTSIAAYRSERIDRELMFQNFMLAYRSV